MSIETWNDLGSGYAEPEFPSATDILADFDTRGLSPVEALTILDAMLDAGDVSPEAYSIALDALLEKSSNNAA